MALNDAVFLLGETRQTPMHVGGLLLLEPPEGAGPTWPADQFRELLGGGVDRQMSRRIARSAGGLGPWGWVEDEDIDLEYHVRHSALPHPHRVRELLNLVGRLHGTLLDRSRPPWETHLIEGLGDGRIAVHTKVHHALVDGVSAMRRLERTLTDDPEDHTPTTFWSLPERPRTHDDASDRSALGQLGGAVSGAVGGALSGVRAVTGASEATLRAALRGIRDEAASLPYQAPRSMLNVQITGSRRFAADSWSLERIRAVQRAAGATLNDVLMGMSAGALRAYLLELDELPDDPLVSMVPVSLREAGNDDGGNAVGVVLCNLGTHLADPAARWQLVRESMVQGKLSLQGLSANAALLVSALTFAPLGLGPLFRFDAFKRPPFNLVISNVPGPLEDRWWRGARVEGHYPLSIPSHGQAVNITASTAIGQLNIGITGDRRALPSLQRLLVHLETSLQELERVAGVEVGD
jgi:WS/DGAT/MGAT family acyltransferase